MTQDKHEITQKGNPGNPTGEYGKMMLADMNEHHLPVSQWALSQWQINGSDIILDIGCGGGKTLATMADSIDCGRLYGIDYSLTALECSIRYNIDILNQGKLQLRHASVDSIPFENDYFDKIITVESFYFWPHPLYNLKEVHRVLKPGGTFLLVADIYGDADLTDNDKENIRLYNLYNPTKQEFSSLFEQAGFAKTVIHTKQETNWICVEGTK